jgi:hypothetical protein
MILKANFKSPAWSMAEVVHALGDIPLNRILVTPPPGMATENQAWVVNPKAQNARVYTTACLFKQLEKTGALTGGKVLPGFKLPLADLFAATRRRKKK